MFVSYITLLIGYSHNDVIMKYLARGLGPHAKPRYVCTHQPDSPIWRQLRIIPVGYSPADDHRALTVAIQGLGQPGFQRPPRPPAAVERLRLHQLAAGQGLRAMWSGGSNPAVSRYGPQPKTDRKGTETKGRLHNRPRLEGGLHVHAEEPTDQPETGVVDV